MNLHDQTEVRATLSAESRLRKLRADIDRLAVYSPDGDLVLIDAAALEQALAEADGCPYFASEGVE